MGTFRRAEGRDSSIRGEMRVFRWIQNFPREIIRKIFCIGNTGNEEPGSSLSKSVGVSGPISDLSDY